ncbi:MAG: glycosyltransferase [Candidatus Thermoplasmatota archaeon]|nr:glycosyltransferase [Candidatus Thermoplasmatota archaeon]
MLERLFFLTIQVGSTFAVLLPLGLHWILNRSWYKEKLPSPAACKDEDLPTLCVVIPTWNEENVIQNKLENLRLQRYPSNKMRFLLIDSASTDKTVEIAKNWNLSNKQNMDIIDMPVRLGKSAAINRAIPEIGESEVFVMTDAEAILEEGALRRIGRWMKDPAIGGVCGTINNETENSAYRYWYNWFRTGESRADSTPIFEGSIAAYRTEALEPIDATANADDSQLAVIVRNKGLRTISDQSIRFSETPLTNQKELHHRTVRRGQGLTRHFWRNKDKWFRNGRWGTILGLNGLQHTLTPWFVLLGILAGLAHAGTVVLVGWFGGEPMIWDRAMLLLDALVLASLGLGITGLRIPFCASAVAFLVQNLRLVQGMVMLWFGRSLHQWEQSKSNRPIS